MRIDGIEATFLDIPAEYTQEYNRWYDLDHMPEHVSKPDVIMGRRYVAPKHLRGLALSQEYEAFGGHAPYLTIYSFGGPLDFTGPEALEGWRTMDSGIVRAGRYWQRGQVFGAGKFRVGQSTARPGCLVSAEAIPHLNHRGVIVAYGRAPSPERRDEAISWWQNTHLVDLFGAGGVLAAVRYDPVAADDDRILHVLLCDESPEVVMPRIEAVLRYGSALGRYPAHKGAYEPLCFLPYERIVPLQYDFDL